MSNVLKLNHSKNYDFQIVVLKCPYTTYYKDPEVRKYFEKMLCLKYKGYFSRHNMGVQPVDGTDMLTDHLLICKKNGDDLIPLNAVKSLPLEVCEPNNIDFTIKRFLKDNSNTQHLNYLTDQLYRAKSEGKKVSYYSSWTMDPDVERSERECIKEIFGAITYFHHKAEGIDELYGLGVPKMKTDTFFFNWGFQRPNWGDSPLPNINFKVLNSIDGVFIHLKEYSDYIHQAAKEYTELWNNRITVGESFSETIHKIAA